jgi:glycosyltransferase involved in cell wall biosynthesis
MMRPLRRYVVITPARDEEENLPRLAEALAAQAVVPICWLIVDDGSTDETPRIAFELAQRWPWIRVQRSESGCPVNRGAPIVRAFNRGIEALRVVPDVVVKLDADVSFGPDYFEKLLDAFTADPELAIASGSAYEFENGTWRQRHMTGTHVWGASRAYRWARLGKLLPLDEQMGWDGLDVLRANMNGWTTRTLTDLPFRHHRKEGERDGARRLAWAAQGRASHYMGYRFWYLAFRSLHHSRSEPAALAMIAGYLGAAVRRRARCDDTAVRKFLRSRQRVRDLPRRALEAHGARQA